MRLDDVRAAIDERSKWQQVELPVGNHDDLILASVLRYRTEELLKKCAPEVWLEYLFRNIGSILPCFLFEDSLGRQHVALHSAARDSQDIGLRIIENIFCKEFIFTETCSQLG